MPRMEHVWPALDFDAFSIKTQDCNMDVQGIDGDQVRLKGDGDDRSFRNVRISPAGRWLCIYALGHTGDFHLSLQLPRNKSWTIDFTSGHTNFKAIDTQARFNLMFGKGDIKIENCRGAFSVVSGNVDVKLKQFTETEIPEVLSYSLEEPPLKPDKPESWPDWFGEYWNDIGFVFGVKMAKNFFGPPQKHNHGISLKTGHGDFVLEEMDVRSFVVKSARSDIKLKGGRVTDLDIDITRGDIECHACEPGGDWNMKATQGDIKLSLLADTTARLDAATRHGDIHSRTPLVRVTRQGPESWHGSRMVGTVGNDTHDKVPDIRLVTQHGDINIDTLPVSSSKRPSSVIENPVSESRDSLKTDSYQTPMEVLTALSEGRINIEQAERLLRSLGS
jgi:hypothetical protein